MTAWINAYMKAWGWFYIDVKKGLYWQIRRKERGDRAWQEAYVHFYGGIRWYFFMFD